MKSLEQVLAGPRSRYSYECHIAKKQFSNVYRVN